MIDKPSGLPAVPGRGAHLQDCVASRVQAEFADALVVHRLDMATSGLMLMARGAAAQRSLSHAFARREVDKRYVAVVAGLLPSPARRRLGRDRPAARRRLARTPATEGRPATAASPRSPATACSATTQRATRAVSNCSR